MKITQYILIFIIVYSLNTSAFWNSEKPIIIPRESWWANELYNSKTWEYWVNILKKRSEYVAPTRSESQQETTKEKIEKIESYLYGNFLDQFTSEETLYSKNDWDYTYAWPIKYTESVDAIVIHHTHSEYENSLQWIKDIHRYHSLNRQWWDIGYNYIIWYNGEIFEWREGWDYVVWAHSKYNNFGTVWIAIIGNYHDNGISDEQYESLEELVQYLIDFYGIDLNKKRYYHRDCYWNKCDTFYIETYLDDTLVWHRDASHTSCPWDRLYEQIQTLREDNLKYSLWNTPVFRWEKEATKEDTNYKTSDIFVYKKYLEEYSGPELKWLKELVEKALNSSIYSEEQKKKLKLLRVAILLSY